MKTIKLFRGPMSQSFVLYQGTSIKGAIYATRRAGKFEANLPDGTALRCNASFIDAARSLLNGPTDCDLGRCKHQECLNGIF